MSRVLVVVDYQNDFVDGALGFDGAEKISSKIYYKVETELQHGNHVFFTKDTHGEDYLSTREGTNLPIMHCLKETSGWQLYGSLNEFSKNSHVNFVNKPSFGSLELLDEIEKNCPDVDEIELCGLVTNLCVISNAVLLQNKFPNASIIIDAECCDSYDKKMHEEALDVMDAMQMKIMNRK